jgi:probable F420-dependent oxidoreductase
MQFGAFMFPTDYSIPPVALGRALEERGFESIFFPEHSHIPTSRETPYPGGGDLPKEYADTFDPFVALAAVAAVTERLRLATGVALVVQRDPIHLAKEVSTLDRISNGRVILGIGAGWNAEEMRDHGSDPSRRFRLVRERIEAAKALWTQSEAEYHGEFVDFGPAWQWPKPVQRPHPPILVGGNGPGVLKRVVAYGDGWLPNRIRSVSELKQRIDELQRMAAEAGRAPIPVSVFGVAPTPGAVEELAGVGVERAIFPLPPRPADEVIPLLDRQAKVIEQFA